MSKEWRPPQESSWREIGFVPGGGELGRLIRQHDWAETALGPLEIWPNSLKAATSLLLHSSVPIVLLWGHDGIMIYNDAYAGFAGSRHPKLLGSKLLEGWPEVADFNEHVMKVGLAGGTLTYRDQESTLYRKGFPERVWLNLDFSPVFGEDGRPAGVIAVVVETTKTVLAERRIATEHARLRQMFEQAPGIMALLRGPDHIVELANPACLRLVGIRDVIGKPVREAIPELVDQGFIGLLDQAYRSGETIVEDGMRVTLQRNAEGLNDERFVDFVYQPVADSSGLITGIFVQGVDVTERERGLKALHESENRFRALISTTSDAIYRMNPNWTEMLQLPGGSAGAEIVPRRNWSDTHIHMGDRQSVDAAIRKAIASKSPLEIEHRVMRSDGSWGWALSRAAPLLDEAGDLVEWIVAASDITGRKKAESQRQLLIDELNHRVKNTLATVQSMAAQTFRSESASSRAAFDARLRALSKAHDLLTCENWEGAGLRAIASEVLAPFGKCSENGRIILSGADVRLRPRTALALGMALSELAVNAAKYGALSVNPGKVSLVWQLTSNSLVLVWREEGGPPVAPPTSRGFGSRFLERGLEGDLKATVRLDYAPAGLICLVEIPLDCFLLAQDHRIGPWRRAS